MENDRQREPEIDALARIVKDGFDRMDDGFEEMRAGFTKTEERFKAVDRRLDNFSYKLDQLELKVDQHRQETNDDSDTIRRVMGGMTHTIADHEDRIKALEKE